MALGCSQHEADTLERDPAPVADFVKREMVTLPLSFDALHLIGWTGRLHFSFGVRSGRT